MSAEKKTLAPSHQIIGLPSIKSSERIGDIAVIELEVHKRSWKHDEFRSCVLIKHLGKRRLDEVSVIQLERYKQDRLASITQRRTALSPASVNRELELLSAVYTYAAACGLLLPNPCRKVKRLDEDNDRTRTLFYEEEARLMSVLTGRRAHLRPIVQLAMQTMLRKSELLSLRKANLDFERGLIWVVNSQGQRTKSKKSRPVPMNSLARQIFLELCRANNSEFVFPNKKTGGYIKEVKTAFTAACLEAGVEDLTFHDFRRTGATRLGEAGADAFYITAILGHADAKTSQIYTVATNDGLRRAMESLCRQTDAGVPTQEEKRPLLAAVNS